MHTSLHLPHFKLIGSKWTSVNVIQGWNHFVVVTMEKKLDRWEVEMAAVCDKSIRFWVVKKELKDPEKWRPGWLSGFCEPRSPA